jgi:hypothetical protein
MLTKEGMNDLLLLDGECTLPNLIVGDTVRLKSGEVGIIYEAQTTINGCVIDWDEELPTEIEHGWRPSYEVHSKNPKCAWFDSEEFSEVIALSELRKEHNLPY